MSWELPPALQQVHGLVAADAPWPRSDEMPRLDGAGSWLDLASASQGGRSQADSAVAHVRAAGNIGADVNVFEDSYTGDAQRMDDGARAGALVATGTTAVVVFKTVWKYVVFICLVALLISLIQGFRLGPALGALFGRQRVLGTRKALRIALAQVERNIGAGAVNSLRAAKHLLQHVAIFTAVPTAPAVVNAVSLQPSDDNAHARADAESVLWKTPEGRAALAYAKEHGITTLYQSKVGLGWSEYNPALNVISIGGAKDASPEALAGEFVRQVHMAKDRWGPNPVTMDLADYDRARNAEEQAASQAAYRMGSQLGHEQDARYHYRNYGSGYMDHRKEHDWGLAQMLLNGPFRLFNDGPLDFT
ncbi:hypothetical protein [Nonomuraea sp. NPDC049400]|uniref:hypothetical protein n=1 Tax=Nonomuraea sp. NPDC049400 TaxID=3364352 RepID=UPI0037B88358